MPHHGGNNGGSLPMNAADPPRPMLHVLELPPFVDALPLPERLRPVDASGKLRVTMREIHAKVHRDLPPTRMWSYGPTALGPLIEARTHQPLQVEWVNALPQKHFLPVDHSLHGCGPEVPEVRAIVHVHGARVPTAADGHPDDWYVPGQSLRCTYPFPQDAATLWYHDHAMGLNRLNVYAGLFGMLLLRDPAEDALHLPSASDELPILLYDRDFTDDAQLYYPSSGDPAHPWVSEFAGDAILLNGKIRPYHQAEPHLVRLRLVNAANSRFFRLSFSAPATATATAAPHAAASSPSATLPVGHARPEPLVFHQIGSDQGLLAAPVTLQTLVLAPGERADLLLDLSQHAGGTVHMLNAALPILEFRVAADAAPQQRTIPAVLRPLPRQPESAATLTRTITLNEYQDKVGNSMLMLLNRKRWHEPVTERPRLGSTEIWEFLNLTEDVHPMHLHLVRFQILDRRPFEPFDYLMHRQLHFTGPAAPPPPQEMGWKDVVQCPPGVLTRILVRFEGFTGDYLYHCHILEHEANDMMRPFQVIA